ncbi:MAG: hypothetical protein OXC95_16070 [Dehalococcoidia bacterium]|nr:hypothetical protein [Dehalococcoidia bacterium]
MPDYMIVIEMPDWTEAHLEFHATRTQATASAQTVVEALARLSELRGDDNIQVTLSEVIDGWRISEATEQ